MSALHHLAMAVLFSNASVLTQCESEQQFRLVLSASTKRISGASLLRCANAVRLKQKVVKKFACVFYFFYKKKKKNRTGIS